MKILKSIIFIMILAFSFSANAQETKTEPFKPTMKMEGRIMYDFNFLNAGDSLDYAGNEFRRVRWATKGKLAKHVAYKVEFDWAGGAVNFRDVYLKFTIPNKLGSVLVGSFTEPSSFNNMTSSKYITFFERSMMSNTQPFKYNSGFMYNNQKILNGKVGLQLAYTFNGDKKAAFIDKSISGGGNFIARVTGVVLNNKAKHQVLHLGVNYENRQNDSDSYSYKFRVENHMGDKYKVSGDGVFENTSDIGFELASTFGPFSLQAEYELASIKTDLATYNSTGYYAFVSYFLTGEHRPYKNSTFGRVKPKKDCMVDGGYGAIELVTRFSVMDFSNYPDITDNNKITNITAGVNWYLNRNTRIMYNFTYGDFADLEVYGNENLVGHLIRFQVDF